jgi:hypothetical protein
MNAESGENSAGLEVSSLIVKKERRESFNSLRSAPRRKLRVKVCAENC